MLKFHVNLSGDLVKFSFLQIMSVIFHRRVACKHCTYSFYVNVSFMEPRKDNRFTLYKIINSKCLPVITLFFNKIYIFKYPVFTLK